MKVVLDMDEQQFYELWKENRLPGRLAGTEKDMTMNTMFTNEDIWNRAQEQLLDHDEIEKVHEYGLDEFLGTVIKRLNHHFDAEQGMNWSDVDDWVQRTFDDYCSNIELADNKEPDVSLDGLRTALIRYSDIVHADPTPQDEAAKVNGEIGKCGPWSVFCKIPLRSDATIDRICYDGRPMVSCYWSNPLNPENEHLFVQRYSGSLAIPDKLFSDIVDIMKSATNMPFEIAPFERDKMNANNNAVVR